MSLITGKTNCKRCKYEVANEDMAGDICINCLQFLDNQKAREERRHMERFCSDCLGYAVKKAADYRGCNDVKCCAYDRELELFRKEAE